MENKLKLSQLTLIELVYGICYDGSMPRINLLKEKAIQLRDNGYSYSMINKDLSIAKSTLSNWFKERPFKPNLEVLKRIQYGPIKSAEKSHNKKVLEIEKLNKLGILEIGRLNKRELWILGLGLYIGEGTKTYENIRIINSDPAVIRLAIRWFKEICGTGNDNITVTLHIYPDNNIEECIKFWMKITGLPLKNFRKPQIDIRKDKSSIRKRKLLFGTAHINIICKGNSDYGVRLHRRIMGWISGVFLQV